jgi:hypothetical protein
LFDKHGRGSAAAERFDTERAASGKEIEHLRAHDGFAQTGQDGSLYPIHGGANPGLGNKKLNSAGCPGDDSHGGDVRVFTINQSNSFSPSLRSQIR